MNKEELIILSNPHEMYQAFLEVVQDAVKEGQVRGIAFVIVTDDGQVCTDAALSKGEPASNLVFGLEKLKLKLLTAKPLF